jgi:outer membrane biosynthesis protein TonB
MERNNWSLYLVAAFLVTGCSQAFNIGPDGKEAAYQASLTELQQTTDPGAPTKHQDPKVPEQPGNPPSDDPVGPVPAPEPSIEPPNPGPGPSAEPSPEPTDKPKRDPVKPSPKPEPSHEPKPGPDPKPIPGCENLSQVAAFKCHTSAADPLEPIHCVFGATEDTSSGATVAVWYSVVARDQAGSGCVAVVDNSFLAKISHLPKLEGQFQFRGELASCVDGEKAPQVLMEVLAGKPMAGAVLDVTAKKGDQRFDLSKIPGEAPDVAYCPGK